MAEALLRLLDRERAMLLAGDLAGIEALGPGKEAALAALAAAAPPAEAEAGELGRRLARNQALLAAAIEGLRDAARRRAALEEARTRLSSYDARGARAAAPAAPPRVERRA